MVNKGFLGPNEAVNQFVVTTFISTQWGKISRNINQNSLIEVNIFSLAPVEK